MEGGFVNQFFLFVQEDCHCVCSVDSGSRLTCITVLLPEQHSRQPCKDEEEGIRVEEREQDEGKKGERGDEDDEEGVKEDRKEEIEDEEGEDVNEDNMEEKVKKRKKVRKRVRQFACVKVQEDEEVVGDDTEVKDRKRTRTSAVGKRKSKK